MLARRTLTAQQKFVRQQQQLRKKQPPAPPPHTQTRDETAFTLALAPHSEYVPTLVRRIQSKLKMLAQHFQRNHHLAPHFTVLNDTLQTVDVGLKEVVTVWYKLCNAFQQNRRVMAKERLEKTPGSESFPGMLEQIKNLQANVDALEVGRRADQTRMETLQAHLVKANERIHAQNQKIALAATSPTATPEQREMGEIQNLHEHIKVGLRQVDKLRGENKGLKVYMRTSHNAVAKGLAYLQASHTYLAQGLAKATVTDEDTHITNTNNNVNPTNETRAKAASAKQDGDDKDDDDSDCMIVEECPPPRKKRMRSSSSSSPKPVDGSTTNKSDEAHKAD
jgi:hypothetical protein